MSDTSGCNRPISNPLLFDQCLLPWHAPHRSDFLFERVPFRFWHLQRRPSPCFVTFQAGVSAGTNAVRCMASQMSMRWYKVPCPYCHARSIQYLIASISFTSPPRDVVTLSGYFSLPSLLESKTHRGESLPSRQSHAASTLRV